MWYDKGNIPSWEHLLARVLGQLLAVSITTIRILWHRLHDSGYPWTKSPSVNSWIRIEMGFKRPRDSLPTWNGESQRSMNTMRITAATTSHWVKPFLRMSPCGALVWAVSASARAANGFRCPDYRVSYIHIRNIWLLLLRRGRVHPWFSCHTALKFIFREC